MRRVKWLKAQWPQSLTEVVSKIKGLPYSSEKLDGFIIDRIRDDYIEARYIEKFIYSEKITDPFGAEEIFERTGYQNTSFTLFAEFPQIEIRDAPRSTRELLNKLQEICDFSVAIVPISINLIELSDSLQKEVSQELIINSLQISDFIIESGVSAKILIKGEKDVRVSMQDIVVNRKYCLEKIQIRDLLDNKQSSINISRSGTAVIPEEGFTEISKLVRNCICKCKMDE